MRGVPGKHSHFNLRWAVYHLRGYLPQRSERHRLFSALGPIIPGPGALPQRSGWRNVVGSAAFSLCQGRSYPALELRDSNKGWEKEWFMVSNPVPCLPARIGRALESRVCWEELPTVEEMVQVNLLLNEIASLSA